MQRTESCDDQEREVRASLKKNGIPLINPLVLRDEAESGTKCNRDVFVELMTFVRSGQVRLLVVDDQARFSRADHAFALINDVVFHGGRFISTGEGIDTTQEGWELRVKVMELHNSTTVRETARRVRRGQKGRVLDGNGSAGDFCFGYCSEYVDANWAELLSARGPKPKKIVVIYQPEAEVVKSIFALFLGGWSIGAIARELNATNILKGRRCSKPNWAHQHVHKILGNTKYIGEWRWGETVTVRDSQGRTRQARATPDQIVTAHRPDLRIIDDTTWKKAQVLLARLLQIYGKKPGQKSRAAKVHHTEVYPAGLLNGLIFCSDCGSRMTVQLSGKYRYFGCPNHVKGVCRRTARVRVDRAEKAIVQLIGSVLQSTPNWMQAAIDAMREEIRQVSSRIPRTLIADRKRLTQIEKGIVNLITAVEQGSGQSLSIGERIRQLENEAATLREQIEDGEKALKRPAAMPDDALIRAQLADQASLLRDDVPKAALLLRRLLGRVWAHEINIRGKKRSYIELRFRIDAFQSLACLPDDVVNASVLKSWDRVDDSASTASPEFSIILGGPMRMDRLAPKIASLRKAGTPWNEIGRLMNMSPGNAWTAWKRWTAQDDDAEAA